jgi:sugar phosphate isomerase/epimerase
MVMTNEALINLKGRFPYRLGTTSYILPEAIIPNLRFLGPLFDEIELVLFDSRNPYDLPSEADVAEMAVIGKNLGVTYNIHLPTDIYLGSANAHERREACETILRFYGRMLPLAPTAYILHFERETRVGDDLPALAEWRRLLRASISYLLDQGLAPELMAVENIDYPFSWVDILADEFGLKFCLDLGHFLRQNVNLSTIFNRYRDRTFMLHLHGVNHKDHQALTLIPQDNWLAIQQILRQYRQGVSIEVFSLDDLRESLIRLKELC